MVSDAAGRGPRASPTADRSLQRMTLVAGLLVVVQVSVGMVVNLYVTVPAHHPGSAPANYFTGSYHSVVWAVGHGPVTLVIHALLGLALVVVAIVVAVRAVRLRATSVMLTLSMAALLVIGAGFNGASFLDFGKNISSLLMALLGLGALSCYLVATYLLSAPRFSRLRRRRSSA